jgi:hypothetical protein
MHEWTLAHPNLTFTLTFFLMLVMHNIVMALIKPPLKNEEKELDEQE